MGAAREKDQADFDLESLIELFDEALTSDDTSVQKTLQHLMVICALARNHQNHSPRSGPLRRLYEDMHNMNRRLERLETGNSTLGGEYRGTPFPGTTTTPLPAGPHVWPHVSPNTGTGPYNWPGSMPPGTIWASTSATDMKLTGAVSASTVGDVIAERAEQLLNSPSYKGSSVGAGAVVKEKIN